MSAISTVANVVRCSCAAKSMAGAPRNDRRDVPAQTMTSTGGVMTSTGGVISSIDTAARTNWVVSVVSDNAVLVLLYPRLPHAVLVTAE